MPLNPAATYAIDAGVATGPPQQFADDLVGALASDAPVLPRERQSSRLYGRRFRSADELPNASAHQRCSTSGCYWSPQRPSLDLSSSSKSITAPGYVLQNHSGCSGRGSPRRYAPRDSHANSARFRKPYPTSPRSLDRYARTRVPCSVCFAPPNTSARAVRPNETRPRCGRQPPRRPGRSERRRPHRPRCGQPPRRRPRRRG